jgi:hypothetical protein
MPEKELPQKHYIEIRQHNGDRLFIIKDQPAQFRATMAYNPHTSTYTGVKLSFFDDNYQYVFNNREWISDLHTYNIREVLKENGFTRADPTPLEKIIHSGHPLLD